jgi:hypothetical protein
MEVDFLEERRMKKLVEDGICFRISFDDLRGV